MDYQKYEVVYPLGKSTVESLPLSPPVADLNGKTICGSGHTFWGDEAIPQIVALLQQRYHNIKFIPNSEMPQQVSTKEEIAEFQKLLREKGCDILLSGNGC